MTTVTQIISDAYRQGNLIAAEATPTTNQITEGLRHLNRIVKSVFGKEAGEDFTALPVGNANISRPSGYPWYNTVPDGDWIVPTNTRLMLNLEEPVSVYLHPNPNDGARFSVIDVSNNLGTYNLTVYGNGRLIESANSLTLNTNGTNSDWFYRGDIANWVKYSPLLDSDTFPFPEEFDMYFIGMLALAINPSYGVMIDDQTVRTMRRSESQLKARYAQTKEKRVEKGLYILPTTTAQRGRWGQYAYDYDPSERFTKGYPE